MAGASKDVSPSWRQVVSAQSFRSACVHRSEGDRFTSCSQTTPKVLEQRCRAIGTRPSATVAILSCRGLKRMASARSRENAMTDLVVREYGIGMELVIALHGGPAAAGDLAPLAKGIG